MKDLFPKTSPTNIVAVLVVVFSFALLFCVIALEKPSNDTRATQIITGLFGVLMLVCGYYFGASRARGPVQQQAENITNTTTPEA